MKKRCTDVFLMISVLFLALLLFPEKSFAASTTVYGGVDYSPVYNYDYYIAHNPDVANAYHGDEAETLEHFVKCGMSEGRRASESFDVHSYYLQYPDLRRAFGSNRIALYMHYINHGSREGRTATGVTQMQGAATSENGIDYSPVYNYQYYVDHNPDVLQHYGEDDAAILHHFIECGMSEGRRASESFDVRSYYLTYPDLRSAFGANKLALYMHYINHGRREGRTTTGVTQLQGAITSLGGVDYSAVYNYQYYVNHNPDVLMHYGEDDVAILSHFINCGMSEGRRASASFDVHSYYLTYPDLRRAFGANKLALYMHYVNHGSREGRTATGVTQMQGAATSEDGIDYSPVYNYQYYVDHNPDVLQHYGEDDAAILHHFVNCGMSEGRQASAEFNATVYRCNYSDLKNAYGGYMPGYYLHFIKFGKNEGRNAVTPTSDCTGWCVIGGNTYYYYKGNYATGVQSIAGTKYYFSDSGVLYSSKYGIDVSSHQGKIDWDKVKNAGVEFAMIRIGFGDDDPNQDDAQGARNISECKRLGIPYGVYLYSYASTTTQANSEANHILRLLNGDHPPLGIYYDVEEPGNTSENCRIVMEKLKSNGYSGQVGIYTYKDRIGTVLDESLTNDYKLWLAYWNTDEQPPYSPVIWQYSNGLENNQKDELAPIDGISGRVDRDFIM